QALEVLGRHEIGRSPSYGAMFKKQNLIKRTDENGYVLVRDMDQVSFWNFYLQLPYPLPRKNSLSNAQTDDIWMQNFSPKLQETEQYLEEKLSFPLSELFRHK